MTKRTAITLTASALMLGGSMVGCTTQHAGLATLSAAAQGRAGDMAATAAADARAALAKHKAAAAVAAAETAVRWQPQDASYRALLGQSYLTAGRFASAREALADALSLSPSDGRVALNLALAQIASGDWDAARQTLATNATHIPTADLGLAVALAGDPTDAVQMLTEAARAPGADAKTRQNLALALALSGRWTESKAVASLDLGADQVDRRIQEWAAFAYPKSAADQVASLLGVSPVVTDAGQPASLALTATVPNVAAAPEAVAAQSAPVEAKAAEPVVAVATADPAPAPAAPEAQAEKTVTVATVAPVPMARPSITFAAAKEVVQPVAAPRVATIAKVAAVKLPPAPVAAAVPASFVKSGAAHRPTIATATASGTFFVQLGAYENAGVAQDGWKRATRRYRALASFTPQGMTLKANGVDFYRLSVGGFSRPEAVSMCRAYRAHGGVCFVRAGAGDQVAQWVQPGKRVQFAKLAQPKAAPAKRVQLASR